jgi:hypothetical protein
MTGEIDRRHACAGRFRQARGSIGEFSRERQLWHNSADLRCRSDSVSYVSYFYRANNGLAGRLACLFMTHCGRRCCVASRIDPIIRADPQRSAETVLRHLWSVINIRSLIRSLTVTLVGDGSASVAGCDEVNPTGALSPMPATYDARPARQ